MKRKYILKNKRRFYTLIFTITLLLFTTIFATNAYGYKEPVYKEITVRNGDTLWNIAQKYNSNNDVRKCIYEIKKTNHLETSEINTGLKLKIRIG